MAAAVLAACSSFSIAQDAGPSARADQAYEAKQFGQAAALYAQAAGLDKRDKAAPFNAACSYALAGDRDNALRYLEAAFAAGYLDADRAAKDAGLASLRGDARFEALLARMTAKAAYERRLWDSPALATPYAPNISDAEKIAGLSRLWSEVKYNFVYVDTLKKLDWDKL